MKYCAAYYSDIGIQKETNQDSLLLVQRGQTQDDEAVLAVICDGVGGLKMGERSSAAVVTAFRDWFYERVLKLYVQETPETELFDDWDNLIQSLHIRLKDNSEKAGFRSGTTVEAVLFMKGRYYISAFGISLQASISRSPAAFFSSNTMPLIVMPQKFSLSCGCASAIWASFFRAAIRFFAF